MSHVAVLPREPRPAASAPEADCLGPAEVIEVTGCEVVVRLDAGTAVRAVMALAFPYRPVPGDVLLVIGRREAHYVIGVVRGSGGTALTFAGDVAIGAEGGSLRLSADKRLELRAPELDVLAGAVKVAADSLVQRVSSLYQRVTGLLSLRAGESRTLVDGTATAKSKRGIILTEEKMTINGKQIYLG